MYIYVYIYIYIYIYGPAASRRGTAGQIRFIHIIPVKFPVLASVFGEASFNKMCWQFAVPRF